MGRPKSRISFEITSTNLEKLERIARAQSLAMCDILVIIAELPGPVQAPVHVDYKIDADAKLRLEYKAYRAGIGMSEYLRQKIAAYLEKHG